MNYFNNQNKITKSICFTNFFCNKSFCRAISNNKFNKLIKSKSKKSHILNDVLKIVDNKFESDVMRLSEISGILFKLKNNFCKLSEDDFKSYFVSLKSNNEEINCVDVSEITKKILVIMENVVPYELYGCNKNKKVFYDLIRFIMKGMLHQSVTFNRIVHKWDLTKVTWLQGISDVCKTDILCKILIWIIKNTVCSIIAVRFYVTVTKITHETRKLYFYFKEDWQRLSDKITCSLLNKGDIVKCESFSLGSKSRKKLSLDCRRERKFFLKRLPVMRLMLKSNSSVRVIIRYKKLCSLEKRMIKNTRTMFKCIYPNVRSNFNRQFVELFNKWKENGEPKLYFVKADLTDAFGSVNVDYLRSILANLHINFQRTETNLEKKKSVAKEYQKMISDLRKPVLVREGSCAYEWKRGLVQGMRFSPILCEMYYNDFDSKHLSQFLDLPDMNLLIRLVDDYLFITDNIKLAMDFLNTMTESGRINENKTICNFTYKDVTMSSSISFFGYILNTHNLEVARDEKVYNGQICYRISFSSGITEPIKFLENRITQTTVPLTPLFFNLSINSLETIWSNIFTTLCISANKFCTIIVLISINDSNFNAGTIFNIYKRKVAVRMCDSIIKNIFESEQSDTKFLICINHLRFLAYKALSLFVSKSNICSNFSPLVNVAMKKTNCFEGTWSPHSRCIDRDGTPKKKASKDICRNQAVVKYFKDFNKIPNGFVPCLK